MRQWPGNGADLDFRGVIRGCTALVVAAPVIVGELTGEFMGYANERAAEYCGMTGPQPSVRVARSTTRSSSARSIAAGAPVCGWTSQSMSGPCELDR